MFIEREIPYTSDPGDKHRRLDLYRKEKDDRRLPVILFVHGGGWRVSDKKDPIQLHQNFCNKLAENGFVVASANYRLSPSVKHPRHCEDIADAVQWISENIGQYGGDAGRLYLSGHSAGGHLCAYLFTHPEMLENRGVDTHCIKALIGISGVYDLPEFAKWKLARETMVKPAFGKDPAGWKEASPYYAGSTLPAPMLLLNAQYDTGLEKQSRAMIEKFPHPGSRFMIIPNTSHFLVIAKFSPPVNIMEEIIRFVKETAG